MDLLNNFFQNLIKDNFGNTYKITPANWNSQILKLNAKIILFTAIFYGIIALVSLIILSIIFDYWVNWIFYIIIPIVISIICNKSTVDDSGFIEIKPGHFGLILILGQTQGSMDEPYFLEEGDYREIFKIPFYQKIFSAIQVGKRLKPMEFVYKQVKTSDSAPYSGTHSFLPIIENPYQYVALVLSTSEDEVKNMVEEISLEAMNETFDNYSVKYIAETKNISDILKENYLEIIGFHDDCKDTHGVDFYSKKQFSGDLFTINETGLAGKFLLKTFNPPPEIKESYTKLGGADAEKRTTIINAKAKAEATKIQAHADKMRVELEGAAQAEKEYKIAQATQKIFNESLNENLISMGEENRTKAIHHAALTANHYAYESLSAIGNSDGSPITEGALERVMALALGVIPKNGEKLNKK